MSEQGELVPVQPRPVVRPEDGDVAVAQMIQSAIDRGIDPDGLEKLVGLYERLEDRRSAREFSAALKAFQNACPIIAKNRHVNTGKYGYDYATRDYIAQTIQPLLDRFGLCYRYDQKIVNGQVMVAIELRHTGGHKEVTNFEAPVDPKLVMNDTQKVASATSYATRYALLLALGIATGGDDDGKAAGITYISEDQLIHLQEMVESTGTDLGRFLGLLGVDQLAHLPAYQFAVAKRLLQEKARAKK